jgi:glutaconyl-CoA/methylmalonyl-CoA decarboxylase subunit gamma
MAYIVTCRGEERNITVEERHPGLYKVLLGGKEYLVDYHESRDNLLSLIIDGRSYEVDIDLSDSGERYRVDIQGDHFELEVVEEKKKKLARKLSAGLTGRQEIKSPMSGNVSKIMVKEGEAVGAGQVLMILEAMKMMNEIKSSVAGVIGSLNAKEGVPVATNELLCVVEPAE